jgi:excisionase family DNA binding protein
MSYYRPYRHERVTAVTDELLSTGEAARRLGVRRGTLGRWRREGKVTPTRVTAGGDARWDLAELERQIRDLAESPDEP